MATIALLLPLLSAPSQEPAPLETRIASVTVYADRALVTRKGEAELAEGVRKFSIGKLPAGLSDDSVRLKVGRGAMVVGVEVRQKTDREAASAAVEELRRKRAEVAKALDAAKDEVATLEAAREYITALRAASAEKISKGMVEGALDPAKWADGLKFVSANLTENAKGLREARYRTAGLQEELAALDQKIGSVQGGQLVPYKEAIVSIAAGGTGKAPVEVEYLIGGAGWRPVYDLRTAEDFSGVALAYRAAVRQRTGEDWGDVELTLSTARPQLGASPPPLQTMRLAIAPPPTAEPWGAAPPAAAARRAREGAKVALGEELVDAEKDFAGGVSLAPAAPAEAAVQERGISIQFRVPRAETVPADGEEHVVLVSESTIEARPEHFATPKSAARVFLKGKAKNTTAFPILAGLASVYFGPDFVGRAPLRDIRPGEEFDLFLGQDPGVTVERKKVREFREGPGLLGKDETITYEFEIRVKNLRAGRGPARVVVKEPVPVSGDDRITVKVRTAVPPPTGGEEAERERKQEGLHRFDLEVAEGKEGLVRLVYEVSFPKGLPIQGLPD